MLCDLPFMDTCISDSHETEPRRMSEKQTAYHIE